MLTADQILPRLDRRLTHFSPVDPLLQTAETALNCVEAVRKAGIAKAKGDRETQLAELEKAVESLHTALNALAAVARSNSDRGVIAVLNEYGYRPLKKELEAE